MYNVVPVYENALTYGHTLYGAYTDISRMHPCTITRREHREAAWPTDWRECSVANCKGSCANHSYYYYYYYY